MHRGGLIVTSILGAQASINRIDTSWSSKTARASGGSLEEHGVRLTSNPVPVISAAISGSITLDRSFANILSLSVQGVCLPFRLSYWLQLLPGGSFVGFDWPRQVSANHTTEDQMTTQTAEKRREAGCGVGKVVLYFQD